MSSNWAACLNSSLRELVHEAWSLSKTVVRFTTQGRLTENYYSSEKERSWFLRGQGFHACTISCPKCPSSVTGMLNRPVSKALPIIAQKKSACETSKKIKVFRTSTHSVPIYKRGKKRDCVASPEPLPCLRHCGWYDHWSAWYHGTRNAVLPTFYLEIVIMLL